MKTDEKYFNFPIHLLNGFLIGSSICLNDIFDYAIYQHSKKYKECTQNESIEAALKWFNVTSRDLKQTIKNGKQISENTPSNSPKVGISITMYFDYYHNEKTDFEKVCLLGFLAIRSILGNGEKHKPFWKLDNKFWLSRMDGRINAVSEIWELSETIRKFATEYQTVKIKTELRNNWGLTTYSRYTRGFYVSFDLNLEDLVFEAEKRRKSTKEKQYREREKEALKTVNLKLYPNTS